MSRLFVAALVGLLLFAAVPAFAEDLASQEVVEELEVPAAEELSPAVEPIACENAAGLEVVTRDGLAAEITAPDLTLVDSEAKSFVVDLQADSLDATADLTVDMTWDAVVNDYDLEVTAADSTLLSDNAQPFDPSEESVTLPVAHCQVIEVSAYNFFALQPAISLAVSFSVAEPAATSDVADSVVPSLEALEDLAAL